MSSAENDRAALASNSPASPVDAPLVLENEAAIPWDEHCDALVVGFGAAGAAATIEAARSGAKVIATDRFEGGGASAKSGGVVYAGGGTRYQKSAGYEDSPTAMFEYLKLEVGNVVSDSTLHSFCEGSIAMLEWLEKNGVEFDSSQPPRKTSYPPDGCYLYFSGNEAVSQYATSFPPAPRGHRVKGAGLSGARLYRALKKSAIDVGVRLLTQSAVRRLIVDKRNGAVLGAEVWQLEGPAAKRQRQFNRWAEQLFYVSERLSDRLRRRALEVELAEARPRRIRAHGGVILSTGGFIFNREMVSKHAPAYLKNFRLGTSGCDGSGIRLGLSVGGEAMHLERISAWRFINPPLAWVRGMIVDGTGRRFVNEDVYGAKLGFEMCEHHNGKAWLVIDSNIRRDALREAMYGGLWNFQRVPALVLMLLGAKRARTREELARKIGADPVGTLERWNDYNRMARSRTDPMGKAADLMHPITEAPFYALNISADVGVFPCPALTLGGLCVDETTGAVRNFAGPVIPGLYAAGRAAVGIASNHYVSGLALADCIWSGRRAGASAARKPRIEKVEEVA